MKGIYLTEEAKAEIEARIAEIEAYEGPESGMADDLKKILSSATILPVVNWESTFQTILTDSLNREEYPSGVIIQPKQ